MFSGLFEEGVLSQRNTLGLGLWRQSLFTDCFATDLEGVKGKTKLSFKAVIDHMGRIVLEVVCPLSEKDFQNIKQPFKLECSSDFTQKNLICDKASIQYNHQSSIHFVNPITPVRLIERIDKHNHREVRLFMSDIDYIIAPENFRERLNTDRYGNKTSIEFNEYKLNALGVLFFSEIKEIMPTLTQTPTKRVVISISESLNEERLSDYEWRKRVTDFFDKLVDITSFAQGGIATVPIREVIINNKIETRLFPADIASPTRFMPAIQRLPDYEELIDCLGKVSQDRWKSIRDSIIPSLSIKQLDKAGLLLKLVAIESMFKSHPDVSKKDIETGGKMGLGVAFKEYKKTVEGKYLFCGFDEETLIDLSKTRDILAHGKKFEDKRKLVKQTAQAHDIWMRVVLSFFNFKGLFCRYGVDEGRNSKKCNEMLQINNHHVKLVNEDQLGEFEKTKESRMSAIKFRSNYIKWEDDAKSFIHGQGENNWGIKPCCEGVIKT